MSAIRDFNAWLGELPHAVKLCVPGNHDGLLESDPASRRLLTNAEVLINDGLEFEGLRIWGSPTTALPGAFGVILPEDRKRLYARIPDTTDVLVTHGPPYGRLDCAPNRRFHAGDPELLRAVERVRPKLHVFGHIHAGHAVTVGEETVTVNAALLGDDGGIGWEPIVLRMPRVD